MDRTLEAINAIQGVPWRINEFILRVVEVCHQSGVPVHGLPPKNDILLPPHGEWDTMTEEAQKAWKLKAAEIRMVNRGYVGSRVELQLDLATANQFVGAPFWTPVSMDYRGRVYPIPRFNFQRSDYVRAMFLFEKGKVLDDGGLYWLKVHLANCGDFDKVSKRPFDERVAWVNSHGDDISDYATDPLQYLGWTAADKPFVFLAACRALHDARRGLRVHLPVAFDGSCSGLQHLCAMTREEGGHLVNLTPNTMPSDIYPTVAKITEGLIEEDAAQGFESAARHRFHHLSKSARTCARATWSRQRRRLSQPRFLQAK